MDFQLAEMIRAADPVAFVDEAAIDWLTLALAVETSGRRLGGRKAELLERTVGTRRWARHALELHVELPP